MTKAEIEQALAAVGPMPIEILNTSDRLRAESDLWLWSAQAPKDLMRRSEIEQALAATGPMPIDILAESYRLRAESDLWLELYRGDREALATLVAAGLI